jgi:hypothetical protein
MSGRLLNGTIGEDFPDALMKMIRLLAEAHQGEGDYRKAASAMSSFKFDAYRYLPFIT